jgi:hypothetical protein
MCGVCGEPATPDATKRPEGRPSTFIVSSADHHHAEYGENNQNDDNYADQTEHE